MHQRESNKILFFFSTGMNGKYVVAKKAIFMSQHFPQFLIPTAFYSYTGPTNVAKGLYAERGQLFQNGMR